MEPYEDYQDEDGEQPEWTPQTEANVAMTILSLLSIMGTSGNALVLYVFSRRKDRLVSTLFILSLAMVDFSTCLVVVPFTIFMEYVHFRIEMDFVCKLYHFLITCNVPFSAMVMVAIALDRYFCICHPWLNAITTQGAKYIVLSLGVLAVILGVCVACMYGIYHTMLHCRYTTCNSTSNVTSGSTTSSPCHLDVLLHEESVSSVCRSGRTQCFLELSNLSAVEDCFPRYVKTSTCEPNTILLNADFQWYYHKMHMAMYVICFFTVVVLYVAIYRSVLKRRRKRQNERRRAAPTETFVALSRSAVAGENHTSSADPRPPRLLCQQTTQCESESLQSQRISRRFSSYDGNLVANLKTAAMLFVVTVVFVLTFLPAWLMIMGWMPFNTTVFYLYFANNAANPIIYSFMNRNFRDSLKRLLWRKRPSDRITTLPLAGKKDPNRTRRLVVV